MSAAKFTKTYSRLLSVHNSTKFESMVQTIPSTFDLLPFHIPRIEMLHLAIKLQTLIIEKQRTFNINKSWKKKHKQLRGMNRFVCLKTTFTFDLFNVKLCCFFFWSFQWPGGRLAHGQ